MRSGERILGQRTANAAGASAALDLPENVLAGPDGTVVVATATTAQ